MDALAKSSIQGVAWSMLRVLGQTGIGFGVGIFLARTLEVNDFGLMAMALGLIGLAELISTLGVEASLIQRKDISDKHLSVAFTLSLIMATLILLLFCVLAEPLAGYFNQPSLGSMLPILGIGQFFSTIGMVPRAILRRKFQFKILSQITLFSYLVGYALVSVALVLFDYGVWSIVIGTCVNFILSSALMFIFAKFFTMPTWSKMEVSDLLNFGIYMTGKYVLNYVADTSITFIIGKVMSPQKLGLYSRADQIASLPLQKIASTFSSVMFPIYSSVQHDKGNLADAYLKTVAAIALLTAPPLAVMAVTSEIVIVGLYGEKWLPAAPILSVLSIAAILVCILHLAGALVEATNHVIDEIKLQLIYLTLMIVGFSFAAQVNLLAVAGARLLGIVYLYIAMSNLSLIIIEKQWSTYLKAQAPGMIIAALLSFLIWLLLPLLSYIPNASYPLRLGIVVGTSGLLYLAALLVTPDKWLFGGKQMIINRFTKKRIETLR